MRAANRRITLRARDGDRCFYCAKTMCFTPIVNKKGREWWPKNRATVEHLMDQKYGGGNEIENTVLACAKCNSDRAEMPFEQKMRSRKFRNTDHRRPLSQLA